jgi:hypothetical protein
MTTLIVLANDPCLRFLLVALTPIWAFLLQLSEHLSHIFHFIPDLEAHENGSELLSRHGDTITRPRSDLDDLLLSRFVLRALGKSRKNRCRSSGR